MQHRHSSQTSLSHLFDRKSIWKLRLQRRPLLKQFWWWTFHLPGFGKQTISNKKSNRETKNTPTVPKYVFIVLFDQMMKSFGSNFFFRAQYLPQTQSESTGSFVSVSNSKQHMLVYKDKNSCKFFFLLEWTDTQDKK